MKKRIVKHYNVHDILTFQIVYEDERNYFPDFNFPFSYFEVESVENPDIILNIGPFEPNNDGCDIVFKKYHIKKGYIYCREQEGLASWQVEFEGVEDETTLINFAWLRKPLRAFVAPNNFSQVVYLESLLGFKLAKKGCCLLHVAAICNNNNEALLLSGRSGSSKTSAIVYSIKELEYSYLGDDKIIVNDGFAYCFPRYFGLFCHLLVSDYSKEHGTFIEKLKAAAYIMESSHRSANGFKSSEKGKIKNVSLVYKVQSPVLDIDKVLDHYSSTIGSFVNNNLAEDVSNLNNTSNLDIPSYFFNLMCAYTYIFPENRNFFNPQKNTELLKDSIYENIEINEVFNLKTGLKSFFDGIGECKN